MPSPIIVLTPQKIVPVIEAYYNAFFAHQERKPSRLARRITPDVQCKPDVFHGKKIYRATLTEMIFRMSEHRGFGLQKNSEPVFIATADTQVAALEGLLNRCRTLFIDDREFEKI